MPGRACQAEHVRKLIDLQAGSRGALDELVDGVTPQLVVGAGDDEAGRTHTLHVQSLEHAVELIEPPEHGHASQLAHRGDLVAKDAHRFAVTRMLAQELDDEARAVTGTGEQHRRCDGSVQSLSTLEAAVGLVGQA